MKNDEEILDFLKYAMRASEAPLGNREVDTILAREISLISPAQLERFRERLARLQQDLAIERAIPKVHPGKRTLGRYIESVREEAGLSRDEVAKRLGKTAEFVKKMESGVWNLHEFTTTETADLLEFFHVNLRLATDLAVNTLSTNQLKSSYKVAARSHGGRQVDVRSEDVDKALDAFIRKLNTSVRSNLPSQLRLSLEKVREELRRRGRVDLLE